MSEEADLKIMEETIQEYHTEVLTKLLKAEQAEISRKFIENLRKSLSPPDHEALLSLLNAMKTDLDRARSDEPSQEIRDMQARIKSLETENRRLSQILRER